MNRIQGIRDSRIPVANLAVVFCFVLVTLSLGSEIDSIIKAAPGHEAYPEAGALILLDRRVETVDRNNSTTLDRYLVVKVFEDRGRDEFGEITQRFNLDGQTVAALSGFGRYSLKVSFIVYVKKSADYFATLSAVNLETIRRFSEAGIELARPASLLVERDRASSPRRRGL